MFEDVGDLGYVLFVDLVGVDFYVLGFLDVFVWDVVILYMYLGRVEFWIVRVGYEGKGVEWLLMSLLEMGVVNLVLVSGSMLKKVVLVSVDWLMLMIWDIRGVRLEYE